MRIVIETKENGLRVFDTDVSIENCEASLLTSENDNFSDYVDSSASDYKDCKGILLWTYYEWSVKDDETFHNRKYYFYKGDVLTLIINDNDIRTYTF